VAEAKAPYNFVPFSGKILARYETVADLPRHDEIDPTLKTGEIHVTMTAQTPVFVSDGNRINQNGKAEPDPHFFRTAEGKYAIPGSTVRGMVRGNMRILGFGLIRPGEDLEDTRIYFREMAAASKSTGDELKAYYRTALGVESAQSDSGKTYSIPGKVCAGYLKRVGDSYFIQPVKGTYLRVLRSHPDAVKIGAGAASAVQIVYTAAGDTVGEMRRSEKAVPGMQQGYLLTTGSPVGKTPNHLYVFPEKDGEAEAERVPEKDVISYRADWESRRNSLKAYYDPGFWALPEEGEEKPVFYARHDGHLYFGMSLFLRIGYGKSLSEGIPDSHKRRNMTGEVHLDYPYAVLGFAGETESYRSRVSFEDFEAVGDPRESGEIDVILGDPKPSFYPGYTVDGKHYNGEFALRGHKRYWLKDAAPEMPKKQNVAAKLRPLSAGTQFHGVIRYKNLHEDELGLLLWCLRLEEGCCQSIGMGKPYGFGRMELQITELVEFDMDALYGADTLCPDIRGGGAAERYIDLYDAYAAEKLRVKKPKKKPSLRSLREVEDFFYLCKTIRKPEETAYMTLEEYKESNRWGGILPAVEEIRAAQAQPETESAPEDLYAALLAKYGRR